MNDAERDIWLREALRHAPDSDALPPSSVSEAILLKARAVTRTGAAAPRRDSTRITPAANTLLAFWAWLARPPVAAGFASVMAATLVGLMWWDQPMDETMPRAPAVASGRAERAPLPAATAPTAAAPPPARPVDAMNAAPPARSETTTNAPAADDSDARRRGQQSAPEQAAAGNARLAEPATTAVRRKLDPLSKERALPEERKNDAPAPFPSREAQSEAPAGPARKSFDAGAIAAKKDADSPRAPATVAAERAAAPSVVPTPAPVARPAPLAAATPPPTPLASGRLPGDDNKLGGAQSDSAVAKSAGAAAPPAAPAAMAAPREVAAAPSGERIQRQRALGDARDKDAAGFASSAPAPVTAQAPAPAPFRNEPERARPDSPTQTDSTARADAATSADSSPRGSAAKPTDAAKRVDARAAPLAQVLAAIAADPERWSRQTARGDTASLDAGWRAWLAEIDAAADGRWRPRGAGASAERDAAGEGTTTLRLVTAGRVAAVVRSDGSTVHVDMSPGAGGDRWQASLGPAGAERVRAAARRVSP